jgi:hypothetical protein
MSAPALPRSGRYMCSVQAHGAWQAAYPCEIRSGARGLELRFSDVMGEIHVGGALTTTGSRLVLDGGCFGDGCSASVHGELATVSDGWRGALVAESGDMIDLAVCRRPWPAGYDGEM